MTSYADTVRATAGLVDYYRLNESSGDFAEDTGGPTISANPPSAYGQSGATGDGDHAIRSDTIPVGTRTITGMPSGTHARSFEFLWKAGANNRQTILSYGTRSTRQWNTIAFNFDGSSRLGFESWADDQKITGLTSVFDGNWHHIVYTMATSTNQVKLYVDGTLAGIMTFGGTLNTGTAEGVTIGQNTQGAYFLDGYLDELAIYDVELSPTTIADHYAAIGSPDLPVASFIPVSTTITEGDTVHFTDTSDTAGGTITAWAWSFGDGGTSTSQNPSHQYAGHGTFTVTLTITVAGVDYAATGTVHSQADVGYTPPLPGLALVEIYVTSPGSARWDQANWDEAVWSSDSWQNVTPEATDITIIWGSQRPELGILSTPDAASWGIGFFDPGRLLDPANADSPYFNDIVPGLPVRITHRGWVVKQGVLESAGHNFDLNSFQSHNAGYFRVTDSQSLMARSKVPSDTTLGDDLFSRARDAIAAAGLSIVVVSETFAIGTPGSEPIPIGHVHDLVPWVTGTDWTVWQWITDAAAQVLHVPYIDRHGNLGFRQWNLPKDYGKELASPNLVGLGSVIFQNGTYSVVTALDDDGVTLRTAEITPKPYYGAVTYDDRATKPTPNAQDWADAVLADRAVAGLRWVPGEVFPLTANDVRYFAEIEAIERVDIDYPEANPPISTTGIVVGGQIVITPVQEREARWSFLFQVAATEDQPLVDDDLASSFLVNDDDPTDYLYPG